MGNEEYVRGDAMKSAIRRPAVAVCLWLILGLGSPGRAAVSDHLFWGQVLQGRVANDPNQPAPLHLFVLEARTDATVSYVEFVTAAGYADAIPADASTTSDEIDTYHWTDNGAHVWEYWGYFEDPNALQSYGDGTYTITLHYTSGSQEQTTVWYGIPGTTQPIPTPTQKPVIQWPPHDGFVASPVTFRWEPLTDPNAADIYLHVRSDANEYLITDIYGVHATESTPYDMHEGKYEVEFALETFYSTTNPDGISFDVLKSSTLLQPFEVVATTVYRFWSPATDHHFYTLTPGERDKLLTKYADVWTFEGPAFYAWASAYEPNLAPVYRFWSSASGSHFFTIDPNEKNKLVTRYSDVWTYEGVAFYAYPSSRRPADCSPVYRFWKPSDNTHFFTISEDEKNKLLTRYSTIYTFEGIAFYARK
jgi:hypothetical protein